MMTFLSSFKLFLKNIFAPVSTKSNHGKVYQLDPYLVGSIVGAEAFSPGDLIVITKENNYPGKVRHRRENTARPIRVILGDESDDVYGEAYYDAKDLGYPLSQKFWSQNQLQWYKRCHTERWLLQRWNKVKH